MSSKEKHTRESKFLSLLLRHKPEEANLNMDPWGWVDVDELINNVNEIRGHEYFTNEKIIAIVESDNKGRYSFSCGGTLIRANQGHSINVDVGLEVISPPSILYHGTSSRHINSIMSTGLSKMSRQHVHLSTELDTANNVGNRHVKSGESLVVFTVFAEQMERDGYNFYKSANGVWLTDHVPANYIKQINE